MRPAADSQVLLAIGLAALATYALRLGGLLLASRLPRAGRLRRGMEALPGALLFSLVAPSIAAEGGWGLVATGLTALIVLRWGNTLVAMGVGVAVIWLARQGGL
ncbi:MAG: hypothetical protein Kow0092_37710 [Deferrisomatales bacterium]